MFLLTRSCHRHVLSSHSSNKSIVRMPLLPCFGRALSFHSSTSLHPWTYLYSNRKVTAITFSSQQKWNCGHFYHSSTSLSLPVRRRRHRNTSLEKKEKHDDDITSGEITTTAAEEEDTTTTTSPPSLTFQDFQTLGDALLDKLEKALQPMKAKNDPFIISRFQGDIGKILRLDLGPTLGIYQVEFSDEEQVFEYSSPISGKLLYFYSTRKKEWIGVDDGNSFEGILVRDLIRQCQGLPDL
jgi:frataxin-like iron-binding protein CyaY